MKIRSLFAATLIASSSAAFAAPVPFTFDINATVPSSTSLDVWDPTGWATSAVEMRYDRTSETFRPVTGPLQIKGGVGAVEAYLTFAPELVSGADTIAMNVTVGTVPLAVGQAASIQVATAAEALAGVRRELAVTAAAAPVGGYVAGTYSGPVSMMFDTVAPAP